MAYKHDYDKILTRLTIILSKLNSGEELSIKELAEEFNTSTRTIQRDFNERLISFPIYQEKRKWKMRKGFKIEKKHSLEDKLILDIIEKITEGIGGNFATKSHKLLKQIKNDDINPIYTKLNIEDISDKIDDILVLENGIKDTLEVSIVYHTDNHKSHKATIQPLKIVNYEGFWYLIALKQNNIKKYYIKNISKAILSKTTFEVDTDIINLLDSSISIWFDEHKTAYEVQLYASNKIAKYFKRRPLPTQKIISLNKNGSMEFSVSITHEMEIIPIIKYWIPHLKVIEPQWLKESIKKDLYKYLQDI